MISVDKNIPIPEITRGVKKYPFDTMAIGESFLFSHSYESQTIACKRIGAIAATWVSQHESKRKFSCRSVDGGIRVWRIK